MVNQCNVARNQCNVTWKQYNVTCNQILTFTKSVPIGYMSKPPLGIGVKRNDPRPWRALAPTRLSWRDPSCGNRWLPGATPPAAPPRPTTTTALLTWARRRLQLRPPVCAQTSPRRPANLSQAAPGRLPDAFQTPPSRLPASAPARCAPSCALPSFPSREAAHRPARRGPGGRAGPASRPGSSGTTSEPKRGSRSSDEINFPCF